MVKDLYISTGVTAKVSADDRHIVIRFDSDPTFVISMMRGADGHLDSFMTETKRKGVTTQRLFPYNGVETVL